MAQIVESGSIQLDTNSNIVTAGSIKLDSDKPKFEETPFKGKYPNIYAGLKTAADMVPYMKYVDPEERERFNQLATDKQTRELLIENLYAVVGMGLPTIGKSVASVVSPLAERLLPKTFKFLTQERTLGKVNVAQPEVKPEVKPVPEASPVVEPIAKPKIVKAKSIELDKPEVKVEQKIEPKVEPKIEPVVEPKIIPAESIKLDAPEVKADVKTVTVKEPWEMTKDKWDDVVKGRSGYQGLPKDVDTSNIFHSQYLKGRHNVKLKEIEESYSNKRYTLDISSPRTSTVKEHTYYRDTDINKKYPQKRIYDSAVVDKDLNIIDKNYKKFEDVFPNDRTPDENYLYRGMSSPEFEQAINNGVIKSRGDANLEGQVNETYFANNINQASSYAGGFAPWYHAPSFEQSGYVVKVKKPATAVNKGGGEVAVSESIPISDIDKVYELRVVAERPGEIDIVSNIYGDKSFREGSSYGVGQNYVVREVPKSEWGDTFHKRQVKQAISEGKPVPKEVLKDYPDLQPKTDLPSVEKVTPPVEKPVVAEVKPIKVQPKETKVIPTTKKAEANVVSPKEQKTYVLDKVDELITDARKRWKDEYGSKHPDKEIDENMLKGKFSDDTAKLRGLEPTIIIEVPNDGRYKIPNTLNALLNFQRKFKALKTSTEVPDIKSPMPSKKPTGKPISEIEKEAWDTYRSDYEAYKRLAEDETLPSESRDYYRSLAATREPAVQEWIKTSGTDIPKEPKGVQLNSGLDPTIAIDIMKTISAKTSEIIEANKMTPSVAKGVKAGKDAMIEHHRNIRRAESTSKLFEKTVNDIVPDPKRQMMMVHAYENKMRGKYWSDLTEIEKGVVRWIAQEKAKIGQYIKSNKILETMPENERINHIYHHWINKETGEPYQAMYGRFSKGLPQAKQRVIPTYEKGIENGMTPATTNIGKLVGLELESVTRANNARQLFKTLHGIKGDESMSIILSPGGKPKPIRMVESWNKLEKQGLTDGYIRYDNSFLDTAMTFESSDGRLVTMKGPVGVKEELHPFVRSYLESPTYGKLSELNFAAKSLKLGASLFHVVSLGMQELANMRIPFVHIPKGLKLIKELSPEVRLLHQEGLELFKGYEDLGFQDKFFDNATKFGKVGNAVTYPISLMRDFIFKYVQPGMKASFADMQFRKLLPRYLKDTGITAEEVMKLYEQGKPLPKEALQCAREVVQKADGHFSGEDFKRSMLETNRFMVKAYFTPEARKAWQAALLSPTWQREHLIVAKNVAKSFMPDKTIAKLGMAPLGPIKSQYRKYALGAIMMVGAVDMWNYMSTQVMDGQGKHLWENPTGKGFAVRAWWDEPAYTMKTKNGQDRYIPSAPAYIRPLKSVFEVAEWVHDPVLKASYKFSPVVAAIGEQFFGQKRYVGLPDIPDRAKDFIIDSATPIVVDQWIRTAQGKQSAYATAMPFFGMPVSRLRERDNTYKIKYKDSSAQ